MRKSKEKRKHSDTFVLCTFSVSYCTILERIMLKETKRKYRNIDLEAEITGDLEAEGKRKGRKHRL